MRKIKEVYIRWLGVPILAFVMVFFVKEEDLIEHNFFENYLITLVFTTIFWNGVFLIIKLMRNRFEEMDQTAKRLILTSLYSAVFIQLASNIIGLSLGLCTLSNFSDPTFFFRHTDVSLISAFMVASLYEASYFFYKWKESVVLNQELKSQQIRTQYGVLQNQMSPHFLFNSLNTLTTLISEDQNTAIDFTQTLAEVYRYILQNRERELVPLDEEIAFCQSYVFLLKKRYPENLHVDFSMSKNSKYIAPLTIQMLIENAIKHNVVSKSDPLYIKLTVDDNDCVVVKNKLQIKKSLEKSTKTGLTNIQKRYALLGNRVIDIQMTDGSFVVKIPLIELISEVEHLKPAT